MIARRFVDQRNSGIRRFNRGRLTLGCASGFDCSAQCTLDITRRVTVNFDVDAAANVGSNSDAVDVCERVPHVVCANRFAAFKNSVRRACSRNVIRDSISDIVNEIVTDIVREFGCHIHRNRGRGVVRRIDLVVNCTASADLLGRERCVDTAHNARCAEWRYEGNRRNGCR